MIRSWKCSTIEGLMNDNINMDSTISGSMYDNINMDSTIVGSMNDNINMDSTIVVNEWQHKHGEYNSNIPVCVQTCL
jgi:hypothetical protein